MFYYKKSTNGKCYLVVFNPNISSVVINGKASQTRKEGNATSKRMACKHNSLDKKKQLSHGNLPGNLDILPNNPRNKVNNKKTEQSGRNKNFCPYQSYYAALP
jgi:hypothetical protein